MNRSLLALLLVSAAFAASSDSKVTLLRVPNNGIQPQVAVDTRGVLHMIYYTGDARGGDVSYVRSTDQGAHFSAPIRVNSVPGSAVAAGTIRGAQLVLGKAGRVHVAWNGYVKPPEVAHAAKDGHAAHPQAPMFYTRMNDAGTAFEPQRNLMQRTIHLDGGGAVAADSTGGVYVAWHGNTADSTAGEAGRQVWIARSEDEGKTFAAETPAWKESTGACSCCGMQIFAGRDGAIYALYRSATANTHRDIYLLTSRNQAKSFEGRLLHRWDLNACPMSSMAFAQSADSILTGWETQGQVYWARSAGDPIVAPGESKNRKHPRLATNVRGETLLAWTEGTGWQKGGSFAWQVFDRDGKPTVEKGGAPEIPAWSFAAVFARPDGGFSIIY